MTNTHRIHPQLASLAVELAVLTPDPRNARAHDDRNIEAVMASYAAHGQRKPIVVQRQADDGTRMVVRAGNGQCEAAKRLGWSTIAAIVIDESDKDAIAFALRDNRTAELAEWDLAALADNMRYLQLEGVPIADVGWEPFEAEPLIRADWSPVDKTDDEFERPAKRETIHFTAEQWLELKSIINDEVTADGILAVLRAGRAEKDGLS